MTLPGNVDLVRVRGYWYSQDGGGSGLPVRFDPLVSNLTDRTASAYIKTAQKVATPDPATAYFYVDLIATNDPDLTTSAWKVTPAGQPTFIIEVDHNATVVDVGGGVMMKAVWLTDAATTDSPPPPVSMYYTSAQTDTAIAAALSGGGVSSVNTRTGAVTLAKADVGLGNVDNTTDASKPVSSAQATAIAAKVASVTAGDSTVAIGGTATAPTVSLGVVPESAVTNLVSDLAGKAPRFVPTAVKTSAYTAAVSDLVPVDTTPGAVTITLPTAPADKAQIGIKHVIQGGANAVTIVCGGSDVINKAGGSTSFILSTLNQGVLLQYKSSSSIWYVVTSDLGLSQLDARYVAKDSLTYSALDHGLVADWVSSGTPGTNTQPALSSLVAALGVLYAADGRPRVIYCPPGDYSLRDNGTVWKSGVSLIGAGPGLTRFHLSNPVNTTNPTPLATYTTAQGAATGAPLTDCTFANFEIDGSGVALASYNTGAKGLIMQFMVRARFHNLYIHDCGASGLGSDFLQDSIIDRVVSNNNGRLNNGTQPGGAGIGLGIGGWGASERTTISNCITNNNATHGIFVELQDNTYTPPRGIRIVNSHCEGNRHGISDWGAGGLIVSACTMIGNSVDGFNVAGSGVASIAGRNGLVTGCVIDGNTADGVLIGDTPGGYTVRGNRVSGNSGHGIRLASTTQATSFAVTGFAVNDNDVYSNALAGVRTDCVMTDGFITSNRIRNNGTNTGAATSDLRAGISFNAAANTPTVTNNRMWDNQGSKTQTYGWSITATGTAGSATSLFNNLNGNLTGAFNFATAPSGGVWSHNLGTAPGITSSAQTALIDGNTYANGFLRYVAQQRVWNSGTITPSASANTNGTAATCSPTSGQLGLAGIIMARAVFAGTFGAETATVTFTATFTDNSTAAATVTATATGTQVVASGGLISLAKEGMYVKSVAVAVKSTIVSSTATASVDILATQN